MPVTTMKQYTPNHPELSFPKLGTQQPTLRLFYQVSLKLVDDNSKRLLVCLTADGVGNTLFQPGKLQYDAHDQIGWYMDKLTLEMWMDQPYMQLWGSWPTTLNADGTTGASTSISAGFFGGDATGGISQSATSGRSVADFTLEDKSSGDRLVHVYKMTKCADSHDYSGPDDMAPDVVGPFAKAHLRGVPERGKDAFPLVDIAVFSTPKDRVYNDPVTLEIKVSGHMVHFDATAWDGVGDVKKNWKDQDIWVTQSVPISLGDVGR